MHTDASVSARWLRNAIQAVTVVLAAAGCALTLSRATVLGRTFSPADTAGGTSGVNYLMKALELKFFPELWQIRTSM